MNVAVGSAARLLTSKAARTLFFDHLRTERSGSGPNFGPKCADTRMYRPTQKRTTLPLKSLQELRFDTRRYRKGRPASVFKTGAGR
jgi:hypothetical protein